MASTSAPFIPPHCPRGPLAEPVVADGFESFAHSQYHPLYLNLVVGARYYRGEVPTRRYANEQRHRLKLAE